MDYRKKFEKIMSDQREIALASSVGNTPNVRIVNFIHRVDEESAKDILYFGTFKGCNKVKEFAENDQVSFTTVPRDSPYFVRSYQARVKPSELTMDYMREAFIEKIPEYKEIYEMAADQLTLFEIHLNEVELNLDNMETHKLVL